MTALTPQRILERARDVRREAEILLWRAAWYLERLDEAQAAGDIPKVHVYEQRLASLSRQFVRAQAVLVHPQDERHGAAVAVVGFCDEADRQPWGEPTVVDLGAAA